MPSQRKIPTHRISDISTEGIGIFEWNRLSDKDTKPYSHRDDYYMLGICFDGGLSIKIDFNEVACQANDCLIVSPGQAHRLVSVEARAGVMLAIDPCRIAHAYAERLERFTLRHNKIGLPSETANGIRRIIEIVASDRYGAVDAEVRKDAANLIIGMILSQIPACRTESDKVNRYAAITIRLRTLLQTETNLSKPASAYADALHLSVPYLNEAVKAMTGVSTTAYVRQQIVVKAKRLLAYTTQSIAEIARTLGFEDPAYFSRLFSRETGLSPSGFRHKNRESSN